MTDTQPMTKGEQRRADVLQIARSHLITRGYEAFSMREVAADLGTKLGHIQYYFPTRDDLLEALVREEFRMNLAAIETVTHGVEPTISALEASVRKLVALWTSGGARVYVVMPFLAMHNERFRALNAEINSQFYDVIAQLLRAMAPETPERDLKTRARLITAVMDGGLLHTDGSTDLAEDIVFTVLQIASRRA